ncbi:MAG: hypothetical protein HY280_07680 [Nitrospinae bacterium]|nr:hypothetical protein [Nitrospinota bacterium]
MSNRFEIIASDGAVVHGVKVGLGRWLVTVRYKTATKKIEVGGSNLVAILKWLGQDEHFIRRILENGE